MSFLNKDKFQFDPTDITEDVLGSYLIGAGGSVISSTGTYLDVNVASASGLAIFNEDDAASSADAGQSILLVREDTLAVSTSADGDYGHFKSTNKGELYVHDTDVLAQLVTIDGVLDSIKVDTGSIDTKLTSTNALLTTIDADTSAINTNVAELAATVYAEDSAHTTADKGNFMLAVRNDTEGSLVDADGDYAPFQVDSLGRLRTVTDIDLAGSVDDDDADSGSPLKVGSRGVDGLLTALSASNDRADLLSDMYRRVWVNTSPNVGVTLSKPTISSTAAEIAATPQAGRERILVQNLSNKPIYIGPDNTVTSATGIRINKNAALELPWGEDLNVWGISAGAISSDVRVLEVA